MPNLNVSCRRYQCRTMLVDLDNSNVCITVSDPAARTKTTLVLQPDSVRRVRDELTRCLHILEETVPLAPSDISR